MAFPPPIVGRYFFSASNTSTNTGSNPLFRTGPAIDYSHIQNRSLFQHPDESSTTTSQGQPDGSSLFVIGWDTHTPEHALYAARGLYYWRKSTDVTPTPETQPHFIGRFTPIVHTIVREHILRYDERVSVSPTNQNPPEPHFIGRFKDTVYTLNRDLYFDKDRGSFAAEINPNFIGRFTDTKYPSVQAIRLYENEARDQPSTAVQETNVHTIGRFTPTIHNVRRDNIFFADTSQPGTAPNVTDQSSSTFVVGWDLHNPQNARLQGSLLYYYLGSNSDVTITDNPPNFIGRFTPPIYKLTPGLYWAVDTSQTTAPTNQNPPEPHFIGRFTPDRYPNRALQLQGSDLNPTPETNTHFIGRYKPDVYPNRALWLQGFDPNPVNETNTHFLGRFTPTTHRILQSLRQTFSDVVTTAVTETNTHFIGRFKADVYARFQYNQVDTSQSTAPTNQNPSETYFLGRFTPTLHTILRATIQNSDVNPAVAVIQETNTHFIGRFKADTYARFNYNVPDNSESTAPTNQNPSETYFLGRFMPTQHAILRATIQFNDPTVVTAAQPETNTHTLGRFQATQHSILSLLRQNVPSDLQAETNVHTIGRFAPTTHAILRSLLQNVPNDVQVETNTHTIGRFADIQHKILRLLSQNQANDVQVETNPHTIGRFSDTKHSLLRSLIQTQNTDVQFQQFETNQHFLGRFVDVSYSRFRYNFTEIEASAPVTAQPETNTNFIGRYQPTNHAILQSLFRTINTDFVIGPPPPPPAPTGIDPDADRPRKEPMPRWLVDKLLKMMLRRKAARDWTDEHKLAVREALLDAIVAQTNTLGSEEMWDTHDHGSIAMSEPVEKSVFSDQVAEVKHKVEAAGGKGAFDWGPVERAARHAGEHLKSSLPKYIENAEAIAQDEEDMEILLMTL